MKSIQLAPVADISPLLGDSEVVTFGVGPDGVWYIVTCRWPATSASDKADPMILLPERQKIARDYRVVALNREQIVFDLWIRGVYFVVHHVQPLGEDVLLVDSRYSGGDPNGRVYNREGRYQRSILLGDGIEDVQVTADGVIWTSFFDEGVYGGKIGAAGLLARDQSGQQIYKFEPDHGLDYICDCYALNVASETDVWFYYYTEFPLVYLRNLRIERFWEPPVKSSHAFAVSGDVALFQGPRYQGSPYYHLVQLGEHGHILGHRKFSLTDTHGQWIEPDWTVGRGNTLHILSESHIYRLTVDEALQAIAR